MRTILRITTVVAAIVTLTLAVLAILGRADVTWGLVAMTVMVGLLVLWQQQSPRAGARTDHRDAD